MTPFFKEKVSLWVWKRKKGKTKIELPKTTKAEKMTLEDAQAILEKNAPKKKKKKAAKKKAPAKKKAAAKKK